MVFEQKQQEIILRVRLTPNSSCCKVSGIFVDTDNEKWLKINVISVPEKGKANKELVNFLARELKIAKSTIEIIVGQLDRYKKLKIQIDADDLQKWIGDKVNGGADN